MGPNKLRYKKVATYTGLMLLGLLGACSSSLQVKGQFPTPLVQPLPLHAGLYLSPELRGHSYQEQDKERHKWAISTGAAQSAFFSTVLPALFENFKLFEQEPGTDSGVDIVIRPHLKSFQYSLPRETRSKVFEVWMKYNMQVYRGDGELLADWYTSAYGKTPSAFMKSDEAALNAAIIIALRDLGANLSINMARVPELERYLQGQQQAPQQAKVQP